MKNAFTIIVRKRQGERQHGELVCCWEDIIKTDQKEIIFEGLNWIYLAQNSVHFQVVVNTAP